MDLKRFKNVGLWVSIAALVALILQNAGVHINLGQYNEIVNKVLELLVFLGILNNPVTDNKGFLDDQNK